MLYHVQGVHRWEEDGIQYRCYHDELSADDQRLTKWLAHDSPAYKALYDIVTDTRLLKDLSHMTLFKHTGMKHILLWLQSMQPYTVKEFI